MDKLFVSFFALLHRIKRGEVEDFDLSCSVFYLGCQREQAVEPWSSSTHASNLCFHDDPEKKGLFNFRISKALKLADAEGRTAWRIRGNPPNFKDLNELLERNGYATLDIPPRNVAFSGPAVAELVKRKKIPLEVIY